MMISGAWLLSALIWLPSVWAWPYFEGERTGISPVQVKNSVSVYIDRDSDRDRDKKNREKNYIFLGTINIDRDRVRDRGGKSHAVVTRQTGIL